jgi:hypothetical protein
MAEVGRGYFLASTELLFIGLAVVAEVCGLIVVRILLTLHQVVVLVVAVAVLNPVLVMEATARLMVLVVGVL